MQRRLDLLRAFIAEQKLDSLLISKSKNLHYFSGFTGSDGVLFITGHTAQLITDFRYIEQAAKQAPEFEIVRYENSIYETIGRLAKEMSVKTVGFETSYVSFEAYSLYSKALGTSVLCPVKLDFLRAQKDQEELKLLKQAVAIADAAFTHILDSIHVGMSEREVAFELETRMRKLGSDKPAFDTIVASGQRGALPHGVASDKLLEDGNFVTMDFGAVYRGYHSDMTRTVIMGHPTEKQRQVYHTVLAAQLAGIQAVKADQLCRDVDAVARTMIADAGYGEYFGHGLGHCVGLMIHEEPRLSPTNATGRLAENMVVTVEPGIYIPDWGGVRIEDIVLVTASGCDILTASSKQLIEIDR